MFPQKSLHDFINMSWREVKFPRHKLINGKFCSSLRERINAFGGQLLYSARSYNGRQIA